MINFKFDWHPLKNVDEIICVCGNRDIWPCLAEIFSSRFSATGAWGCQHPRVEDVYFDFGHGGPLTKKFCTDYFLPLVKYGTPVVGVSRNESASVKILRYLNVNRVAVLAIILALFFLPKFLPTWFICSVSSCYVDVVRTDDFSNSLRDGSPHSYVRDVLQAYSFNYDEPTIKLYIRKANECRMQDGVEVLNPEDVVDIKVYDMLSNPSGLIGSEESQ